MRRIAKGANTDVQSIYGLPPKVEFCTRCVISNQRPRITFNASGICSACLYGERKQTKIDWAARERELRELLDKHRRTDGSFDVVVPCSGGKDSAIVAHQLRYQYDMHPLTVTWAPHLYTDIGRQNFRDFVDSGFSNIMGTANGHVHRRLTRLAFEYLGDPFQPFIYGQKAFPLQIATAYEIPLVMYGENGEVEYGGDSKNENNPKHDLESDMLKHYFSGIGPLEWQAHGLTRSDLHFYLPPPIERMKKAGVECHFYGYYRKWLPQENFYYSSEHTGFRPNPHGRSEGTYSKYASLDDRIDGFHYYMAYIKFGLGRATSDAAHEIRDGHLTRDEAIALIRRYDGEFPGRYFQEFLGYTGLKEAEFWAIVDRFRSPHLWTNEAGRWKLKHVIGD